MELKIGKTYYFKENPSMRIVVLDRRVGPEGAEVWINPIDRNGSFYFISEDLLNVWECTDLDSYARGLSSRLEGNHVTLDVARKELAEDWGIRIFTSSTEEFIGNLMDLI